MKGLVICQVCGKEAKRTGPVQKYCPKCSTMKDKERKNKWSKNNPVSNEKSREIAKTCDTKRKSLGIEKSALSKLGVAWIADGTEVDNLFQLLRVKMPFTYNFSKNAIWSLGAKKGHIYARKESNAVRSRLTELIKSQNITWYEGKVWIDIMVEKPDMRGDAINVIDLVCDAIKDAIGVDDRWYCIRRLDWQVIKKEPQIIIGVGQSVREHHRVCSTCGDMLPLTQFGKNSCNLHGKSRDCIACSRILSSKKTAERKANANKI
jgi:hypothetical protein